MEVGGQSQKGYVEGRSYKAFGHCDNWLLHGMTGVAEGFE